MTEPKYTDEYKQATVEGLRELINSGFIPFKKIWNGKKFDLNPCDINLFHLRANFNVTQNGGTAIFLIKDKEEYFFGLDIKGQPPILLKQ